MSPGAPPKKKRFSMKSSRRFRPAVIGLAALCGAAALAPARARAAAASGLEAIVVTATRIDASAYDVPASISSVSGAELLNDSLGVNLSDNIAFVPGLLARNGYDYAQDQQISIRGIGADSPFGVRGVRIYMDGIPQTGPDGQGQISEFNLGSAARVEVLRGPFSALYGNSSGGVIQIFTAPGTAPGRIRADLGYGSFGTVRAGVDAEDASGPLHYNVDFTHFSFAGFRPQQSARSESFNGKVDYTPSSLDTLTLVANVLSRPDSQDPQGLSAAEFAADPWQTDPASLAFDTRKSLDQQEVGLVNRLKLSDTQSIRVMGYYGHRAVLQFLSIPVGPQKAPTSSGGVIDLDRQFGGADARWSYEGTLAGRAFSWVAGASYDTQNELRRGYDNFSGATLGVVGALRRNENDIARDIDEYTQGSWELLPRWTLTVGVRHSEVRFISEDRFITAKSGNDSGSVTYTATSPVAGVLFAARPWLHLYASYGQGFQTPLGSELAYRPDASPGLNFALRPSRSDNGELGAKFLLGRRLSAEITGFETLTHDEIVVDTSLGGRSTYQNAGRTRRDGVEASLDYRLARQWRLQLAYTYVDAVYLDAYRTCATAPCAKPTVAVAAGNRLPGVPLDDGYARLTFGHDTGWQASVSDQYISRIAVNDPNSAYAPAYSLLDFTGGYGARLRSMRLRVFMRLDNVLDRHYVSAIIADNANGKYYYPGPGFNVFAGFVASVVP